MKKWQKLEKATAQKLGGRRVSGSGNTAMGGRGDVVTPNFFVECKQRVGALTVTALELQKLRARAIKSGLEPALVFDVKGEKWVAVQFEEFQRWLRIGGAE